MHQINVVFIILNILFIIILYYNCFINICIIPNCIDGNNQQIVAAMSGVTQLS